MEVKSGAAKSNISSLRKTLNSTGTTQRDGMGREEGGGFRMNVDF